jgi:indolepyruvate decarboxylase
MIIVITYSLLYIDKTQVQIHDGPYNDIKNWDYAGLIDVFNCGEGNGLGRFLVVYTYVYT